MELTVLTGKSNCTGGHNVRPNHGFYRCRNVWLGCPHVCGSADAEGVLQAAVDIVDYCNWFVCLFADHAVYLDDFNTMRETMNIIALMAIIVSFDVDADAITVAIVAISVVIVVGIVFNTIASVFTHEANHEITRTEN